MKILLVLGNGFDLNLGLPTSFGDFLRYYVNADVVPSSDNVRKLKQLINDDVEQWSDLERKLGDVTIEYSNPEDFAEAFRNIREELSRYLQSVDSLPINNLKLAAERMVMDLCDLGHWLDLPCKNRYEQFKSNCQGGDQTEVNVMTFNYTSTFERLLRELQDYLKHDSRITVNPPVHIHETLESGLLMGVNDRSQIANSDFRNGFLISNLMVKPLINQEYEDGIDKQCCEMISQADVIVLYGLSIGATDQVWWKEIYESVCNSVQALVYVPYDLSHPTRRKDEKLLSCKQFAQDLCGKMQVPSHLYTSLFSRILPIRQNKFFDFGTDSAAHDQNFRKVYDELVTTF